MREESEPSEPEKEIDEIGTVGTSESASIRGDAMDIDNDLATASAAATTNKENKFSVGESDLVHSMDTVDNTLDKNSQSAGKPILTIQMY